MNATPFIENNRVMVPLGFIADALGVSTTWDGKNQSVHIHTSQANLTLSINKPLPNDLGTARIINNLVFVPLRHLVEYLGAHVRWDGINRTAYIYR